MMQTLRKTPLLLGLILCFQEAALGDQIELSSREQKFEESFTNVTLKGMWRLVEKGQTIGKALPDEYTIVSAVKKSGDKWIITARMKFGTVDVSVPVPVDVLWAGDTPVISVTNLAIPGVGTYTARVLIHGDQYAGVWSGPDYGGLMEGVLISRRASQ
jgi:hypothetical protein